MPVRCAIGAPSLSSLCLALALLSQAVSAQILSPSRADGLGARDVDVWSEQARPALPPADRAPVSDADFATVSRGGPWEVAERRPLQGPLVSLFGHARAGRWDEVLRELQASDANPDQRDAEGATLLTLAARSGRLDVVRELVRRGADVDRVGLHGHTPLGVAAMAGHDLLVQALLRAGADPARRSAQGQSALHLAAREGQVSVLRTLLRHHADPYALNRSGLMAVHEAAGGGSIPAMAVLVEAGVPPGLADRHGLNAVHAAAVNRQSEAVAWLRERGVVVPHPLTQVLLDRPADPLPVLP